MDRYTVMDNFTYKFVDYKEVWNMFRGNYRIETYKTEPGYALAVL